MPTAKTESPNATMKMSAGARAKMRGTEKVMLRYYNDMGKNRGNCTWGIGFYVHKGVCTPEELARKVVATSIDVEYDRRVAEAERRIKQLVKVRLDQAQFDALVSFTYNTTNHTNRDVYDALNRGDFSVAASLISSSVKTNIKGKYKIAPGLITRRAEESAPFRSRAETEVEETK